MNSDETAVSDLIREFYSLQEERVYTYTLFEEGHKIYLDSSPNFDFVKFRQLVHDVTEEFKRISNSIIAIEKKLRFNYDVSKAADLIAVLQEEEKQKLRLTAKLQLAQQELIDDRADREKWEQVKNIKQQLREVTDNINQCLRDIRYEMDS